MSRKYWVFEATHIPDGDLRVGIATDGYVITFPPKAGCYCSYITPPCVSRFHDQYTVTSGDVPPWLEKPLPKLWAFWVESRTVTPGRYKATADEAEVVMWGGINNSVYSRDDTEAFNNFWRILGTPDLPEWLKKGAEQ